MAQIVSSVGLSSGFPIQDTVDQLIALQAKPRDQLIATTKKVDEQRTALTSLTASLIALQLNTKKLAAEAIYKQRTVASSAPTFLNAVATGNPEIGQYQFTPLRKAQAQQLQSSRFTSNTAPIGAGTFSFRFGGFIDPGADLDLLNGGAGFSRGKIRITDRSGATAEIDLNLARTIDDVLTAINSNTAIRVQATVHNDQIRLTDETGQTTSNLRVDELGGTTAASLGLTGINVAANSATGQDVLQLFDDLTLKHLNDGLGVRFDGALGDLRVTLRDGSRVNLDFDKLASSGTKARATTNAANGIHAQLTVTAVNAGPDEGDVAISFVNDGAVTAGNEIVEYDAQAKTLVVRIAAGASTADQVIQAINQNPAAAADFLATRATGSDGSGVVTSADGAVTTGPPATAITPGGDGPHSKLLFTALNGGGGGDNVAIRFVHNPSVDHGDETVTYDDSNPLNKELVFEINQGNTTANDIISVLQNDPVAGLLFKAESISGSNGTGRVIESDTAYTNGGALVVASTSTDEITLKQVLDLLNGAAPGLLQASIGADNQLVLTDLSVDGGYTFQVQQLDASHAAEDLGLDVAASGGTITGRRLLAGLKTTLLSNLDGGAGLNDLGLLDLTDRSGASATVDLSNAKTLDDLIETINQAGLGISASVNSARNGITLTDTTGLTTSNLIVANGDGSTETADRLGLTVDAAATTKSSGNLRLRVIGENTELSKLNGGAGVAQGTVRLIDNSGQSATLNVTSNMKTVGDVITAIDQLGLAIEARINDAGDGILLIDKLGGGTTFKVEAGSGSTARDLSLLVEKTTIDINGTPTQVIDGSTTFTVDITATDTLQDLVDKINATNTFARASAFSDGSSIKPYRFTLFNQNTGSAGAMLFDTSAASFSLEVTVKAQDAIIQLGAAGGSGVLAFSNSNEFKGLLPDVTLSVQGVSTEAVTINVAATDTGFVSAVSEFVASYNQLRKKISDLTAFDPTTNKAALLQGDTRLLRVETDLNNLISGRQFGLGQFQSLESLGIGLKNDGTLVLDEAKLKARFAENPTEVTNFLSQEDNGMSAKFDKLIEQLAGVGESVLVGRAAVLTRKIELNNLRIESMNARLDFSREKLLASFQQSEMMIAKFKASLSAIESMTQFQF